MNSHLFYILNIRQSTLVCGDFNIDLLRIHSNHHFHSYLSKGFFPTITLPTRLSDACNTLIDNILTNNIEDFNSTKSGILINDITDHKIMFTYIESCTCVNKVDKWIYNIY